MYRISQYTEISMKDTFELKCTVSRGTSHQKMERRMDKLGIKLTSMRLTKEDALLIALLRKKLALSQAAVIRLALRVLAQREGVDK